MREEVKKKSQQHRRQMSSTISFVTSKADYILRQWLLKSICNAFGFTVLEVTYSKLDVPSDVYSSFLSAKKGMKAEWIQY